MRIFSFDFSKAFDSVSHRILVSKLRDVDINPYILNWLISFISNRKQRVVVDNIITDYIDITRCLYILRVCRIRFFGYPKEQLDLLFQSLIISVFTYAIEVWGCCYYDKYLKRIDKLFARAFKSGYCLKKYNICDILTTRDSKLWIKITSNPTALDDLLPPRRTRHLRSRGHDYILPRVRTSRFKSTFSNRCLFSIVCH